jgi:hypothetical protein
MSRSDAPGWCPVSSVLFVTVFFGVVGWWLVRELGWPLGVAAMLFAPVLMVSATMAIVTRRRAGYVAAGAWATGSWIAIAAFGWWGFAISALAGLLGFRIISWWSRGPLATVSAPVTPTSPH